jgi:hypothetical protein
MDNDAYLKEIAKRRCSSCGTPIQIIPIEHGNVTFRYPCPCGKPSYDHPLIRVWHGVLPEAD